MTKQDAERMRAEAEQYVLCLGYRIEMRTDAAAFNTGRPLYRVECQRCGPIHPGTTSPGAQIRAHERDEHEKGER